MQSTSPTSNTTHSGSDSPALRQVAGAGWQPLLDSFERLLICGLYGYFVWRLLPQGNGQPWLSNCLLMLSEGLVLVLFVIRRPARSISTRRSDWFLAFGGTFLPLLVHPAGASTALVSPLVPLFLMICGLIVQVHAKLVLGRSIGMVAANRGIKSAGPYQVVRHPMYLGYVMSHVAFWLLNPTGWNLAIYSCAFGIQVMRLLAEERFLAQIAEYREYMQAVRYRLIPGLF